MEIEALRTMNENLIPNLMLMMEIVALIAGLYAFIGSVIYLTGIALLCYGELRQSSHRRKKVPPNPGEPDRPRRLPVVAPSRSEPGGTLSGSLPRRELSRRGGA
ncbi:MAG: hypothetical protein JST85_10020 [Acidobacteria bacterium]|nr:hypothetical protein [Acidobacteriota bacterium]